MPIKRLLFILLGIIFLLRCQSDTPTTYKLTINGKSIVIELADTEQTRAKGLQYRTSLAPGHGMLFAYPEGKILNFWMKDTSIPLSIAFIKPDGSILEIQDMKPFSLESITSSAPAQYALETNRGWFKDNQVKAGDIVLFPPSLRNRLQQR
ncbi:MAG: DUF192 domain-containing protein [Planctomycetes bacterium]|nr:DUF192 domain-containing protein [Planctomycetota bacterium]